MVRVAAGQGGPLRWALDFQGSALDFLTDKNRKELIGYSLKGAGFAWGKVFLPKRFTHYVERHPFPYAGHRLGFFYGKARRMGIVKAIISRLTVTKGWDPWSTAKPDLPLIIEWKKMNPGKYVRSHDSSGGLIGDMRRNAKRCVMEVIDEMWGDGKFLPLVESGKARATANGGFRVRATVGPNKQQIKIAIPFGHPTNAMVGATVRTAPEWEVRWIAKQFTQNMVDRLSKKGLSVGRGGVVTTRAPTSATERASYA